MTRANNETRPLLIGCAAGFSGDRIDAASPVVQELVQQGKPAFLIFETLAERTLALAQLARRQNPRVCRILCKRTINRRRKPACP